MGLLVLVIGLTITLTLAFNTTHGGQSGASGYNCLPLPPCYSKGACPDIINYNIPNFRWCPPPPVPTPQIISCGSPNYKCSSGYTCGRCTGAIVAGQPTPFPNTGCVCIPNPPTATPILKPTCTPRPICIPGTACPMIVGVNMCPPPPAPATPTPTPTLNPTPTPQNLSCGPSNSYKCPSGFTCGVCTNSIPPSCHCIPNPSPTPCGPTNPKYVCPSGQACVYSKGSYACASGYTCSGISGGSCPSGQTCQYDRTSLADICKPIPI
jgi:hypothetical protein